MSEQPPIPEAPRLNEAQEATLRQLCQQYEVEFEPIHYFVFPENVPFYAGWAEGWIGGPAHRTSQVRRADEQLLHPTVWVTVSPEGEAHL